MCLLFKFSDACEAAHTHPPKDIFRIKASVSRFKYCFGNLEASNLQSSNVYNKQDNLHISWVWCIFKIYLYILMEI